MQNMFFIKNIIAKAPYKSSYGFIGQPLRVSPNGLKYKPALMQDTLEFIAKGAEGSVYRILNTNFAIKIKNNADLKTSLKSHINFAVSEEEKINHIKAKIGENIEIMDFIKGEQIKGQFKQQNFQTEKIKKCLEYIYNASQKGMRHDYGGRNIIFDTKTGNMTPIDFIKSNQGQKYFIINDMFIQLYNSVKNPQETESLISKISLGFLDLLRNNTINKNGCKNLSTELKTVKDIVSTNNDLRDSLDFILNLEKDLQNVMQKKTMSGLFPDSQKEFIEALEILETKLKSKII